MAKQVKKSIERRSECPISSTLELIGDKWSLLIIRDMMVMGKNKYNDFLSSDEKIATNILNDRLRMLTDIGIIGYTGTAKRKQYYLTEMGKDLKPIIEAYGKFGMKYFKGSREYVLKQMKQHGK